MPCLVFLIHQGSTPVRSDARIAQHYPERQNESAHHQQLWPFHVQRASQNDLPQSAHNTHFNHGSHRYAMFF